MTAWESVRPVADAVLYEGYLLYPYRATSDRNRSRWQFGVLGPPGAADAGLGEDDRLTAQFLMNTSSTLTLVVRFLQLQHRRVEKRTAAGEHVAVGHLDTPTGSWLTWDEAVPVEVILGPIDLADAADRTFPVAADAGTDISTLDGGRLIRERREVVAEATLRIEADGLLDRVTLTLRNTGAPAADRDDAIARSLIGAHVVAATDGAFVSLLEPPDEARDAAARCTQHRCFPVLAGPADSTDVLLVSPIILYDHPEIAEQSKGALFDSTEIDEILTLRVMTMTDEEKAQARATDPLAAQIIDRCDGMSADAMLDLHGVLRDPHAASPGLVPEIPAELDWWDPLADNAVSPGVDGVMVNGVRVANGSLVRLRPSRRADAQDMFVAGRTARVTSVHEDVDGGKHVAVVIDEPGADALPASYGRYLYFSPDEVEPLDQANVTKGVP